MKKVILPEASKSKTFGFSRIVDGVYPIVKMASYNKQATNHRNESFEYEVLAVFFDADETVLELNGLQKEIPVLYDDGTPGTHRVKKAVGTFFDALFPAINGKSFYDACAYFNDPANGFIGKHIAVTWRAVRSASTDYSGYSYLPSADLFDTKEAAEAALKAALEAQQ